jgi:hypothetical protein
MNTERKYRRSGPISVVLCTLLGSITSASAEAIQLSLPIACEVGRTCFIQNYVDADPSAAAKDYRCGTLTYDHHNGTDIRLPSRNHLNVGVLAAAPGKIMRVRDGVPGGRFREEGRAAVQDIECGNGVIIAHADQWETQYCHLANGSLQVKPGDEVSVGDQLGHVGLSGLTEFPHLHFTVRHHGKIVDPFAYEAAPGCGDGKLLWAPALRSQLAYRERAVLNVGFTSHPVTMDFIDEGGTAEEQLTVDVPALVAFVRAIGLKEKDTQWLALKDPRGRIITENRSTIEKNQAQSMLFTGRKKPKEGWERGMYAATYIVKREAHVVLERNFSFVLSD